MSAGQVGSLPGMRDLLKRLGLQAELITDDEMPEWGHILTDFDMRIYRLYCVVPQTAPDGDGYYWVLEWKRYARQSFKTASEMFSTMLTILDVELKARYLQTDKLVHIINDIRQEISRG